MRYNHYFDLKNVFWDDKSVNEVIIALWRHKSPFLANLTQNLPETRKNYFSMKICMGVFHGTKTPRVVPQFLNMYFHYFCDVTSPQIHPKWPKIHIKTHKNAIKWLVWSYSSYGYVFWTSKLLVESEFPNL